jgi:hypothetical protein
MKLLASLVIAGSTAMFFTGLLPCPCELGARVSSALGGSCPPAAGDAQPLPGAPVGVYLEVRNATVWGGACHIGSEAVSQGTYAAAGWAFEGGAHDGADLTGVRVVSLVEGTSNLQAEHVFRAGGVPEIRSAIWVDAPDQRTADAAVDHVLARMDHGTVLTVERASLSVEQEGDVFQLAVPGVLSVEGEALPDRSCCTMPESLWYSPLATGCEAVVGNPSTCRFAGHGDGPARLSPWAFEGENSAFVARLGA